VRFVTQVGKHYLVPNLGTLTTSPNHGKHPHEDASMIQLDVNNNTLLYSMALIKTDISCKSRAACTDPYFEDKILVPIL
jgi:hypothetical protein